MAVITQVSLNEWKQLTLAENEKYNVKEFQHHLLWIIFLKSLKLVYLKNKWSFIILTGVFWISCFHQATH